MELLKKILFPFASIFYVLSRLRNKIYDSNPKKSYEIPLKSICVGNLSLGGTGKSPLVAYLLEHFSAKFSIQVLSRGYGRKTKGFYMLDDTLTAEEAGDEPLMYYKRFHPAVHVAVCESRTDGIKRILTQHRPDLLILDDAFQHRKVKAGFSILVTTYAKPFYSDYLFPAGTLRESRSGKKRADLLLVSKCPEGISETEKKQMILKSGFKAENVYFSKLAYADLISFSKVKSEKLEKVLLVCGIADPKPLIEQLKTKFEVETIIFPDHHRFTNQDIVKMYKKFDTFATVNKGIITTEKDYVRLVAPEFSDLVSQRPWYYQPISIELDRENEFLDKIEQYVNTI